MAIHWRLKTYLATKHGIYTATDLQRKISKTTGVLISLRQLCEYLKQKPKSLRLETIEVICSALDCKLSHLLEILPKSYTYTEVTKLAPQQTPLSKIGVKAFPDPKDYR
jgi:DNA-binding Xre family transcriptional regulator